MLFNIEEWALKVKINFSGRERCPNCFSLTSENGNANMLFNIREWALKVNDYTLMEKTLSKLFFSHF